MRLQKRDAKSSLSKTPKQREIKVLRKMKLELKSLKFRQKGLKSKQKEVEVVYLTVQFYILLQL